MPAKLLLARTEGTAFVVAIHLDTARVAEDGTPLPEWVLTERWGADVPHETAIAETKLLAAEKLKCLTACESAVCHACEGEEFTL